MVLRLKGNGVMISDEGECVAMKKMARIAMVVALMVSILSGCGEPQYARRAVQNQTYQYKELKKMVEDFQQKVDQVEPKNNTASRAKQYAKLKSEMNKIGNALETYEDDLEYQFESGSISYDDYNRKDNKRELLDNTLDIIENQLEILFTKQAEPEQMQQNTYQYTELKRMVQDFQKKVDNVEPKANRTSRAKQYTNLKAELEQIEDALEYYEDDLEYQYKSGGMTRTDYNRKDNKQELLDNQLDLIEDQLEYLFGIDD